VVKVVLSGRAQHGMPNALTAANCNQPSALKGTRRVLVGVIRPGILWAAVGDPPEDLKLAGSYWSA
jgi:hypothetical protein